MEKGTHGEKEQKFRDLDFNGQSRTINATLQVLEKEMRVHIQESKDYEKVKQKCIMLSERFLEKVKGI